jgi:shikimate dehydrogenase
MVGRTATARVALFGFPLRHSVSPAMHHAAAQALGLPLSYEPLEIGAEGLADAVEALRAEPWLGANVTLPHKRAVLALVDALSPLAARIGAANTLYRRGTRLLAENTDAPALLRALRESVGLEPGQERVLVLGAGGAARATVAALLDVQTADVLLWNRTEEHAAALCASLQPENAGRPVRLVSADCLQDELRTASLVINATSVGIDDVQSPLASLPERHDARLFDLVYGPAGTPLVRQARQAGWQACDGLWMLVYQAAASFVLWFDSEPPAQVMYDAARDALSTRTASLAGEQRP